MRKTSELAMEIPGPTKDEMVAMRGPSNVRVAWRRRRRRKKKEKRKKVHSARIHLCQTVVRRLCEPGL
jgi:hypothetical protein